MATASDELPIQQLFSSLPPIQDRMQTRTTKAQADTVQNCLPYLSGAGDDSLRNHYGIPVLNRVDHEEFLRESIECAPHQAFDSQRPWFVYWNLLPLSILGVDTTRYGDRVVQLFETLQNPEGGIAGGYGHMSHVLTTYAAVLSAAIIGPTALRCFDRKALWRWLGACKQADGGFVVSIGAEEDIRGAYCSMTIIALLGLPVELPPEAPARAAGLNTFIDKLPEWLSKCQTYEGGIAEAPGNEAHGAYAFCGLACACILGDPRDVLPRFFDLPALIRWLSARQYAPEGGFSGRSNKLVDGCYSHWVGGCWPLIHAALETQGESRVKSLSLPNLYHREGIIRYITSCCQQPDGGLRDKPTVLPDSYHSCYVLAGLSAAQHQCSYERSSGDDTTLLPSAFYWKPNTTKEAPFPGIEELVGAENIVEYIHPVFVIPYSAVEQARI